MLTGRLLNRRYGKLLRPTAPQTTGYGRRGTCSSYSKSRLSLCWLMLPGFGACGHDRIRSIEFTNILLKQNRQLGDLLIVRSIIAPTLARVDILGLHPGYRGGKVQVQCLQMFGVNAEQGATLGGRDNSPGNRNGKARTGAASGS